MCINSDRYLAMRACAIDPTKTLRLIEMIDAEPTFDVENPTEAIFDSMADMAVRINIESVLPEAQAE